jgi:hypothetical protein
LKQLQSAGGDHGDAAPPSRPHKSGDPFFFWKTNGGVEEKKRTSNTSQKPINIEFFPLPRYQIKTPGNDCDLKDSGQSKNMSGGLGRFRRVEGWNDNPSTTRPWLAKENPYLLIPYNVINLLINFNLQ